MDRPGDSMTLDGKRDGLDALKLGNELTTRRYLFHKIPVSKVLNVPEYIAMRMIMHTDEAEDIYDGKTYLKDIAEMMQLSIRQTSKLVSGLKERGLIKWVHDGNGSDGTYVTVTPSGRELFTQQEKTMKELFIEYYKFRNNVEPKGELLDLFLQIVEEEGEE